MKMIPPLNPGVEFEGSLLPWIERPTDMCMPSGIQDLAYQIAWRYARNYFFCLNVGQTNVYVPIC